MLTQRAQAAQPLRRTAKIAVKAGIGIGDCRQHRLAAAVGLDQVGGTGRDILFRGAQKGRKQQAGARLALAGGRGRFRLARGKAQQPKIKGGSVGRGIKNHLRLPGLQRQPQGHLAGPAVQSHGAQFGADHIGQRRAQTRGGHAVIGGRQRLFDGGFVAQRQCRIQRLHRGGAVPDAARRGRALFQIDAPQLRGGDGAGAGQPFGGVKLRLPAGILVQIGQRERQRQAA